VLRCASQQLGRALLVLRHALSRRREQRELVLRLRDLLLGCALEPLHAVRGIRRVAFACHQGELELRRPVSLIRGGAQPALRLGRIRGDSFSLAELHSDRRL
jgi:hypothetical protein